MLAAIASALLTSSVVPPVDVGRFDPANFPEAAMRYRRMPDEEMVGRVEEILRERRCRFEGHSHVRFDIRVPYVVQLEPDGTPTAVVIRELNCVPLEVYAGTIIQGLARAGDFRPTGSPEARWYRSELRFTVE